MEITIEQYNQAKDIIKLYKLQNKIPNPKGNLKMCYVYDKDINIIDHLRTDEIINKYGISKMYLKNIITIGAKYNGKYYFSRKEINDKLYFIKKELELNEKRNNYNIKKGITKKRRTEYKGGTNKKIPQIIIY